MTHETPTYDAAAAAPMGSGIGLAKATERCLHRVFELQADRRPSAVALVDDARTMSYGELNRRANRLAGRLRAMGVDREARVGLCMERSFDMIVAILAILKAGGAYAPLDPSHPRARLASTLQDLQPRVVLTHPTTTGAVSDMGAPLLALDGDAWASSAGSDGNPVAGATSEDPAYVIYTSGSTGTPKGVLITHGNAVSLFEGGAPLFNFDEKDIWTFLTSVSFDVSVWEIFGALLFGGQLVIVPVAVKRSPADLLALIARTRATVVNVTPATLLALMAADEATGGATPLAVRLLISAGETLNPAALEPWFERRGDRRPALVNAYGITETTVLTTQHRVAMYDAEQGRSCIGKPFPGSTVYVLDSRLQPVPDGEPGEIFIGGAGVGRGYLNRPDITAQRFLRDPFTPGEGARLYRTGDLARRLPTGALEFLGRIDDQVKIRGFRVETGEVEAALRQHPAVHHCVVRPYTHAEADVRLAAYVVADSAALPAGETEKRDRRDLIRQLRTFLETRLPSYMIPSAFMFISRIPLTVNGKIDRTALPAPSVSGSEGGADSSRPRTALETTLTGMFAELLDADHVGLGDDFFDLGGHSLAAMHLVSRIAERLGIQTSIRLIVENPSVEALARAIETLGPLNAQTPSGGCRQAPALTPAPTSASYPLSFAQQAMLSRRDPGDHTRFNCYGVLEIDDPVDAATLQRAFRELVGRHEVLRTSLDLETMSQRVCAEAPFTLPVYDCSLEQALARRDTFIEPFVVTRPPLMRAELIRLAGGRSHLLFDLHHTLTDVVSMSLMMSELWALYSGASLNAVPLHYKDYAVWQDQRATDGTFARDEAFWHAAVEDFVWTALPDRPGEGPPRFSQSTRPVDEAVRRQVQAACKRRQLTEMAIMLAAIDATMSAYTGQTDITLGLRVSRRSDEALQRMLGLFVEDTAYRVLLPDPTDLRDVTLRTADALVGVLDHPMYPYERLNAAVQRRRPTPNGELFTLLVNWQPAMAAPPAMVRSRFVSLPRPSATRYHVNLRFRDEGSLIVDAKYCTDRYSDAFIQSFIADILGTAGRIASHL